MKTADPNEMEMPCQCRCGEWFELTEGNTTNRDNKTLICDKCFDEEEKEAERNEQIEDLNSSIEDAIITIRDAKKELIELGSPYTKEITL